MLVYWAAATLGPLLLGVSLSMTSYALYASRGIVSDLPGGVSLLLNIVEFALTVGAVAGLFRYVPNTHVQWTHALAGGLFVAGAFEFAKWMLAVYLKQVPTYSALYGTFATVPIFLVWLYLGWVIVLLGAVIAAYAPSLSMKVVRRPATPGHVFLLAITLLRELHAARKQSIRGLSAAALSERLRTDPLQIEPILDELVALDWVGRLEEEGGARYVLLADPETTTAQPLLAQTLLDPSPSLRGFWQRASFGEMTLADLLQTVIRSLIFPADRRWVGCVIISAPGVRRKVAIAFNNASGASVIRECPAATRSTRARNELASSTVALGEVIWSLSPSTSSVGQRTSPAACAPPT